MHFFLIFIILSPFKDAGIAQLARASAFQAEGREFESRFPLHVFKIKPSFFMACQKKQGVLAQLGERFAGSEEVSGSIPLYSTISLSKQI